MFIAMLVVVAKVGNNTNLFNHSLLVDIYVGSIFDHYELDFYEYLSTNYFVIICFHLSKVNAWEQNF